MADDYSDLLIRINSWNDAGQYYPVEAELDDGSRFTGGQLKLDRDALLAQELDAGAYGLELFNALFPAGGDILRAYNKVTGVAEAQSGGRLRVRLWVDDDAVELHAIPWERLYHLHKGKHVPLGASALTPFSRYTSLEIREPALVAETPLRMLVAVSNPLNLPGGLAPANVDVEIENLRRALSELRKQGKIDVSILPGRTGLSSTIRSKLEAEGYTILNGPTNLLNIAPHLARSHIFHFIGHGAFQRTGERGDGVAALYLEKDDGTWQAAQDEEIVLMFTALGTLPHLVFLVACESAAREVGATSPFVGLGPKLVQAGIPAVVAMQEQVPVELARLLSGEFYARVAEHGEVDRALNQARLQVFNAKSTEWAIPVLFMRIRKGRLFSPANLDDASSKGLFDNVRSDPFKTLVIHMLQVAEMTPLAPLGLLASTVVKRVELIIGETTNTITEYETFILLASICLPHLLQKFHSYSENVIAKDQIESVAESLSLDPSAPSNIRDTIAEITPELVTVANARLAFDSSSSQFNEVKIRNERIRPRLLSALLHLATRVSLDQYIVPQIPPAVGNLSLQERFGWWRQAYIRSVSIETHRLQLHFTLPKGRKAEYAPILVEPLDEEIRQLVDELDIIFSLAHITLVHRKAIVEESEVSLIPDIDWQLLKRVIETEQAYKSQNRLQHESLQTQRLREILVHAEVSQAEQMFAEGRVLEAAESFVRASKLLAKANETYQARHYALRAAESYMKIGNRQYAAREYLRSAQIWLSNALTPQLAGDELEKAYQLGNELGDPSFQVAVLIARATLAFATLRDNDAEHALQQAHQLLQQIPSAGERATMLHDLALQHSLLAMVWEEWKLARNLAEAALAACQDDMGVERFDLLQRLLQIATEQGDWETADQAYQQAQQIVDGLAEPQRRGLLTMHYGASLARRGSLHDAYDCYRLAIQQLQDVASSYTMGLAYQNIQLTLIHNGFWNYPDLGQDQSRRIDFFNRTRNENVGYAYEVQAVSDLHKQDYREGLQNIRLALAQYWREGSWAGIDSAYKLLANLNASAHVDKPIESLRYAIRAGDEKLAEQYSKGLLEQSTISLASTALDILTTARPTLVETIAVIKALGILADVIPPDQVEKVIRYLVDVLQGPEDYHLQVTARQRSAEALRSLMPRFDVQQTTFVLQKAQSSLQRQQFWTVTDELLKLVNQAFALKDPKVIPELHESLVNQMLDFVGPDHLREYATSVAFTAARTAPETTRKRVIEFLQKNSNQLDRLNYLAALGEQIPSDELRAAIDRILEAANQKPKVVGQTTRIGISAISPRMIRNFNRVLPSLLYDHVINGLLEIVINDHASMGVRSEAIWTLSDLPEKCLASRATEIVDYLIWGAEGTLPRSSSVDIELASQTDPFTNFRINFGNVDHVRQSSLHALGRIYSQVESSVRERIASQLITASRAISPTVRQGAAMGLSAIESDMQLNVRLLLALVVLMHDSDAKPCSWACVAAGELIVRNLTGSLTNDLLERLFYLAENAKLVEVRTGVAVALQGIAQSDQLDADPRQRIAEVLNILSADVSYRVRYNAKVSK